MGRKRRGKNGRNNEAIKTDSFPQIHVRHQTTESGGSVNTKQDNEKKQINNNNKKTT